MSINVCSSKYFLFWEKNTIVGTCVQTVSPNVVVLYFPLFFFSIRPLSSNLIKFLWTSCLVDSNSFAISVGVESLLNNLNKILSLWGLARSKT